MDNNDKPAILVTSANGNTGFTTAKALLENGFNVRAMVRDDKNPKCQMLKSLGADIFRGTLDDYRDVEASLTGIDRAYFCCPFDRNPLLKSTNFIIAAEKAKIQHVVYMSQWLVSASHPSVNTREQWLAKQMALLHKNVKYTFINTGLFSFTYFLTLELVTQLGLYPTLIPVEKLAEVAKNAPPSEEDQGRVIATILMDPGPHHQKTYRITGPALISHHDVIRTYARVLGRDVKPMTISRKMFFKSLKAMGFPTYQIYNVNYYMDELENGAFSFDGGVTSVVADITGQEPESFETILKRRVSEAGLSKRSMGGALKSMLFFMKILITRCPDLKAFKAQQEFPTFLTPPLYAYENSEWCKEHRNRESKVDIEVA